MHKGFLFVVFGPSGVGKTTIVTEILARSGTDELRPTLSRIITCTTRPKRDGEKDGVDYFFMSKENFLQRKSKGDFAEASEVYGNYYGVLFSTIREKIDNGEDSLLIINWEGFKKIKQIFRDQVIGFFILPPSLKILEERIRSRATDSEEVIKHRISMASDDMLHKDEFDFCVENAVIDDTVNEIIEKIAEIKRFKCHI